MEESSDHHHHHHHHEYYVSSDDTKNNNNTNSYPRGHWRPAEDEKLMQLVEQYGPQNWNAIAEKLQGRSGTKIMTIIFYFLLITNIVI